MDVVCGKKASTGTLLCGGGGGATVVAAAGGACCKELPGFSDACVTRNINILI